MNHLSARKLGSLFIVSVVLVAFQNCGVVGGGGFESSKVSIGSDSSSSNGPISESLSFTYDVGLEAKSILIKNCASCHGIETGGSGGVSNILDVNHLLSTGLIVKGKPEQSRLYQSMLAGRMPKDDTMSGTEIATIRHWIEGLKERGGACLPVESLVAQNAPARYWRLTKKQVIQSFRDLFNTSFNAENLLTDDTKSKGFANDKILLKVREQMTRKIKELAETAANELLEVTNDRYLMLDDIISVARFRPTNSEHSREVIENIAEALYRRPLSQEEAGKLLSILEAGKLEGSYEDGLRYAIEAIFQSPNFWYRRETGSSSYELASRLSLTLWNTVPDQELLDLAETDQLLSNGIYQTQVDRMLASDRSTDFIVDFVFDWFSLDGLDGIAIDAGQGESTDLGIAMMEEARLFIRNAIINGDGTLESLFTSRDTFINRDLAAVYDVPAPAGSQYVPHKLDGQNRGGILSLPGVAVITADGGTPYIYRGVFVRKELLCQHLPEPPSVSLPSEEDLLSEEAITPKQIAALHSKNPACATCHAMIDPIGFGFAHLEPNGKLRTLSSAGNLIDNSADLTSTVDVDGAYAGIVPLGQALSESYDLRSCSSEKMFRNFFGRDLQESDRCSYSLIQKSYKDSGYKIKALIRAYLTSDLFIERGN